MKWLLAFAVSLSPLLAGSVPTRHPKFEVREIVRPPRDWTKCGEVSPGHIIDLRIGLPQSNFELLEEHLYEVSDPDHPRYGQHLSKSAVEQLVAPRPESVQFVNKWLASHSITEEDLVRSPAGDWITVRVPISVAEKMLDTKYHVWRRGENGDTVVRTTSYSLPEELHDHIELVQPTTMFASFRGLKTTFRWQGDDEDTSHHYATLTNASGGGVDPSCNTTITVPCLKQLYNAVDYEACPEKTRNSIGITGYLEEFANLEDLKRFYADQVPAAVNTSFTFQSVKGGLNDQNLSLSGSEAGLDVQFAFGISFPTPGTFWSTPGRPPFQPSTETPSDTNEPYTDWLDFVLSQTDIPRIISTSYGDEEQSVPETFARRVCKGFAQLGARGVTLFFSSGDAGVGDGQANSSSRACVTNDGLNRKIFLPVFPASCPYVTAVGGTFGVPEVAVNFSGGGFSNYFPRPDYQQKAVKRFLKKLPRGTYEGLFNRSGRAYPDVSAQALNFRIALQGGFARIGGTSAASPTVAGFFALLNDARLRENLPPFGFLNPLLYKLDGRGFNDITTGNNPGCGTMGFNATTSWDPVTGFGTPNFGKLKDLVACKKD